MIYFRYFIELNVDIELYNGSISDVIGRRDTVKPTKAVSTISHVYSRIPIANTQLQ